METKNFGYRMVKICSHTIAKNSEDFIEPVLRQILPYTTRSIVSVDVSSPDRTKEILLKLQKEYPHLEIWDYKVENPFTDLVKERNRQLKSTKEEIIWIVDDDEYYQKKEIEDILDKINSTEADACSVKFWFLTDLKHHNPARGKRTIRFYRNLTGREWEKEFGKEFIPVVDVRHLDNSYVHLSYLKKKSWRNDFGQKYKYNIQTPICEMPKEITKELCQKLEHF